MSLLLRRRDMLKNEISADNPYITDGLIFWLDGKTVASASSWIDRIGNREFALYNCSVSNNGVVFNGSSSYGAYNGLVEGGLTIEAAYSLTNSSASFAVFGQVSNSTNKNIILLHSSSSNAYYTYAMDSTAQYGISPANSVETVSALSSGLRTVRNGTELSIANGDKGFLGGTGSTIGCSHNASGNRTWYLSGTINSIRIYNRELSVAEMQQNQRADIARFGLEV